MFDVEDGHNRFRDLSLEQARQLVDIDQLFTTYRLTRTTLKQRFDGTMSWKTVRGHSYLYRKRHGVWKSLGPRSPETEQAYSNFREGRERSRERLRRLATRLDEMAPVNRALQLGRVPVIAARTLRALSDAALLGKAVAVVGTNALFAYERLAGVQVERAQLATADIDLLFDARARLRLLGTNVAQEGLLGILRKVDRSFELAGPGSFRAVNDEGYMVDLIQPMPRDPLTAATRVQIGPSEDLRAAEIEGLVWLVNSPKVTVTAVDARGHPVQVVAPDPRAFALHKSWLATRSDREPTKRLRDRAQADLVAELVRTRLPHLSFADPSLGALPAGLRGGSAMLTSHNEPARQGSDDLTPDW